MTRFTKVSPTGLLLPADATEWVAVYDSKLDVTWEKLFHAVPSWERAQCLPRALGVAGFTDWRLPTAEELYLLADRRRVYTLTIAPQCHDRRTLEHQRRGDAITERVSFWRVRQAWMCKGLTDGDGRLHASKFAGTAPAKRTARVLKLPRAGG